MNDERIHPGCPHRRIVGGVPCPDLDLSNGSGLDGEIHHVIATLFGQVPGVILRQLRVTSVGDHATSLTADVEGWSPTLHLIRASYTRTVRHQRDMSIDPEDAHKAFVEATLEQFNRSRAGIHMGIHAPLELKLIEKSPVMIKPGVPEMRHLLVDSSWPVVAATTPEAARAILRKIILSLHEEAYEGGSFLADGEALAIECGLGRVIGEQADVYGGAFGATFDGLSINLRASLPETMIVAAAGRPLRSVVELHPALNNRIIKTATSNDGRISIQLVPSLLCFDDIEQSFAEA